MTISQATKAKRKTEGKRPDKSKKPRISDRTKSAKASTADPKPSGSKKPDPVLPPVKRHKTGDYDFGTSGADSAPRQGTFEIAERTGLLATTKVKLLPRIVAKTGKITGISFGRNRTPSPLGSRMGDHTGSWASVVDAVHARLYGKDLAVAVAELHDMQRDAQAWMSDETSDGMKLWNMLDPAAQNRRHEVLENYAFTVSQRLDQARAQLQAKAPAGEVAELLADATAHHLAFLNFLPFATVPAKGDSGSKGSGEPWARAKVLAIELEVEATRRRDEHEQKNPEARVKRLEAEAAAKRKKAQGETPAQIKMREEDERSQAMEKLEDAREGLWGLFSMEAAVRAADVERAVAPARIAEHIKQLKALEDFAAEVDAILPGFILDQPKGGKRRHSVAPQRGTATVAESLQKIADLKETAEKFKNVDLRYDEYGLLAKALVDAVQAVQNVTGKVSPGQSDGIERHKDNIAAKVANLKTLMLRLSVDPAGPRENGALLLAHLVHEHQTTVVRAYPNAVVQTKFLGDKPADDAKVLAARRVSDYILRNVPGAEQDATKLLADKIIETYSRLDALPTPDLENRWVADSRTASLVAAFKNDELKIQGRPAAPPGVGGMGSHTTAWVTEETWVRKKLAKVGKAKIADALKKEATNDLQGDLMKRLAKHLPADQLEAGQLGMIFDAALDVMAATEPAEAITAYLSFRNLLPYATVDAGNRGGQAERVDADEETLFDEKSLRAAIAQKLDELGDDRLKDTIETLKAAAKSLADDLQASAESKNVHTTDPQAKEPEPTWDSVPEVRKAVLATIHALRAEADRLKHGSTPKAGVEETIFDTREAEHDHVYAEARP